MHIKTKLSLQASFYRVIWLSAEETFVKSHKCNTGIPKKKNLKNMIKFFTSVLEISQNTWQKEGEKHSQEALSWDATEILL